MTRIINFSLPPTLDRGKGPEKPAVAVEQALSVKPASVVTPLTTVKTFSQISASPAAPQLTDTALGVGSGNTDLQYTWAQIKSLVATATFDQAPQASGAMAAVEAPDASQIYQYDTTWTPAVLGAVVFAWYKADAGVYSDAGVTPATNGQGVQQWNDQSGSGYHLKQATTANKPLFDTTGMSGHQSIDFSSPSPGTWLQTTAASVVFTGTAVTVFVVLLPIWNSAAVSPTISRVWSVGAGSNDFNTPNFSPSLVYTHIGPVLSTSKWETFSSQAIGPVFDVPDQTPMRVGVMFDGANGSDIFNNVLQTPSTPFTASLGQAGGNTITVGAPISIVDTFLNGRMSELVFIKRALTMAEQFQLDCYFRARWGLF